MTTDDASGGYGLAVHSTGDGSLRVSMDTCRDHVFDCVCVSSEDVGRESGDDGAHVCDGSVRVPDSHHVVGDLAC